MRTSNEGTSRVRPRSLVIGGVALTVLMLSGCAPGPNELENAANSAGFWHGLWHGIISPVTFVISLFTPDVNVFEVRNDGGWYSFGFILGVSIAFSGAAGSGGYATSQRRRRGVDRR